MSGEVPSFLSKADELAYHHVRAIELGNIIILMAAVLRKRKIIDDIDEEILNDDDPDSYKRDYYTLQKLGRDLSRAVDNFSNEYYRLLRGSIPEIAELSLEESNGDLKIKSHSSSKLDLPIAVVASSRRGR